MNITINTRIASVDGGNVEAEVYATDKRDDGARAELGTITLVPNFNGELDTWGDGIDCWASDGVSAWLRGLDSADRADALADIVDQVRRARACDTVAAYRLGDWQTDDRVKACDSARRDASDVWVQWTGVDIGDDLEAELRAHWEGSDYSDEYLSLVARELGRMRDEVRS